MAQALRIASIEVASNPDFVKSLAATPTICWRVAAPFSIREFINHLDRPSVGCNRPSVGLFGGTSPMFGTIVLVISTLFFLFTAWRSGTSPAEFAEQLGLNIANAG